VFVADTANNRVLQFNPPFASPPVASRVFGQAGIFNSNAANFDSGPPSTATMYEPAALALDSNGTLYEADASNNRLLAFNAPFENVPVADVVLGQPNGDQNPPNSPDPTAYDNPNGVAIDRTVTPNHLYVADTANSRILGYNNAATVQNGDDPDLVIGQPDYYASACNHGIGTSSRTLCHPHGMTVDHLGNLWVADYDNSRVLKYNKPFASGYTASQPAAAVLGQGGSFTSGPCVGNNGGTATATGMCTPLAVAVGIDDKVYVADTHNNRVLEFDSPSDSNPTASVVLGQGDFASSICNRGAGTDKNTLCHPAGVAVDSAGNLYVGDFDNSRVLEYDGPLATGINADRVFGHADFTNPFCNNNAGVLDANSMCHPFGITLDSKGRLHVSDMDNNRVLEYDTPLTSATAVRVFGQGDNMTSNQCDFGGPAPSADSMCRPRGVALDTALNLYVADWANHRVLEYDVPSPVASPIKISPTSLSFMSQGLGVSSKAQIVTLTNKSDLEVAIASQIAGLNRSDFITAARTCGRTLTAHSSCTISFAFRPTRLGTRLAYVKVTSTPDPRSPHSVKLTGTAQGVESGPPQVIDREPAQ
jgi:sugar lactone lactonase YvrE